MVFHVLLDFEILYIAKEEEEKIRQIEVNINVVPLTICFKNFQLKLNIRK